MAFPRAALTRTHPIRSSLVPRIRCNPTIRPLRRAYAVEGTQTAADGASSKTTEDAEPKILNAKPPASGEEEGNVKLHNERVANRSEKPAGTKGKDGEQEKAGEKVEKGYWGGESILFRERWMEAIVADL